MRPRLAVLAALGATSLAGLACHGGGDGVPPVPDAPAPTTACMVPAGGELVDTSASANVVGSGSAAGCTEAALAAAVAMGGQVHFDCGSGAVTIPLTMPLVINNVAGADGMGDIVIDGGSNVTLDGRSRTRIITLDACAMPFNSPTCNTTPHPALTLERIKLANGLDTGSDGGGAILRNGGALTLIDTEIADSTCKKSGQDTSGGAIRVSQATPTLIVGSSLHGNACSNGGALGILGATPVTIVNTSIAGNMATGNGGNPGEGGNGAGISSDGAGMSLSLCGVTINGNQGNAFGGGIFYVDDAGSGDIEIENTEISNNHIAMAVGKPSQGGGAYLQGATIAMTNVTIANDSAAYAGGLDLEANAGHGSLAATNVTISDIDGTALTAGSGVGGNLVACTFAGNFRALAGAGDFTLETSALGSNNIGCDAAPHDGGGNVQSPDTTCGASVPMMDPQLGALGDHGGTTGVRTRAPAAGSPAIGAGNTCPMIDARGLPRPDKGCTSGAHEAADD